MQQAVDVAVGLGRKVCIVGRSMRKNANIARNLGYMDVPEGVLVRPVDLEDLPPNEQLILCTGSQGEPLSALTRIAYHDHPALRVERGDTVIISAKPVPGNELRVHDTINQLAKAGAEVLHQEIAPVHVSGHACSEELRTLLSLLRPRAVMPVHGEYRMQAAHAQLARDAGVPASNIVLAENGTVVELSREGVRVVDQVENRRGFCGRARRRRRAGRRASGPAPPLRGRRADHRRDSRLVERRLGGTARADRPRLRRRLRSPP
jgi:ribonuclease J